MKGFGVWAVVSSLVTGVLTRSGICSFFLNRLLNFMGVGFSLYGLAALYQAVSQDPIIKHTVKCRYCRKRINEKVSELAVLGVVKGLWLNSARLYGASTARAGRMAGKISRIEQRRHGLKVLDGKGILGLYEGHLAARKQGKRLELQTRCMQYFTPAYLWRKP